MPRPFSLHFSSATPFLSHAFTLRLHGGWGAIWPAHYKVPRYHKNLWHTVNIYILCDLDWIDVITSSCTFHLEFVVYEWGKRCSDTPDASHATYLTTKGDSYNSINSPDGCARFCKFVKPETAVQLFQVERKFSHKRIQENRCKCWYHKDRCDNLVADRNNYSVIYYGG